MQTRKHSFVETITQVTTGFAVSLALQIIIFPHYGIKISLMQNLQTGVWFTIAAIIKGYIVRRWFNGKTIKALQQNYHNLIK